jgi:tRNA-binding EMAP/Myf-like protein
MLPLIVGQIEQIEQVEDLDDAIKEDVQADTIETIDVVAEEALEDETEVANADAPPLDYVADGDSGKA